VEDSLLNHNSVVVAGNEEFRKTDYVQIGDSYSNLIKIYDRDTLIDLSSTTGGQLIPHRTLPRSIAQTYIVEQRKTVQHVLHVTEGIEPRTSYFYHLPDKLNAEVVKQILEIYSMPTADDLIEQISSSNIVTNLGNTSGKCPAQMSIRNMEKSLFAHTEFEPTTVFRYRKTRKKLITDHPVHCSPGH